MKNVSVNSQELTTYDEETEFQRTVLSILSLDNMLLCYRYRTSCWLIATPSIRAQSFALNFLDHMEISCKTVQAVDLTSNL